MEYDTLRIDRRITQAFKTWHEARGATTVSWRQAVAEILIREAGYLNVALPDAPPRGPVGRPPTKTVASTTVPATPAPVQPPAPTPEPAQPDTAENKDKRWVIRRDWSWEKDGPQLQQLMDDANKARPNMGLPLLTRESMLEEMNK